MELLLLPNSRTPGASGAWNTGLLDIMARKMSTQGSTWGHNSSRDGNCGIRGTAGDSEYPADPCADVFVAILGAHQQLATSHVVLEPDYADGTCCAVASS